MLKRIIRGLLWRVGFVHRSCCIPNPTPRELCFQGLQRVGYQPECLIDVGANRGNWSRDALRVFPDLQVVMVEPQGWLKPCSADLHASNPKVQWVTAGVSDEEGELVFTVNSRDDSSTFVMSAEEARMKGFRQVSVEVTTVSSLVDQLSLPAPDIIKIDAEGLDLKVLKGCGELLGKVDLVFVEVSLISQCHHHRVERILEHMYQHGYRLFDVTDLNRSPNTRLLCLMEFGFVRNDSWLAQQMSW